MYYKYYIYDYVQRCHSHVISYHTPVSIHTCGYYRIYVVFCMFPICIINLTCHNLPWKSSFLSALVYRSATDMEMEKI